MSAMMLMCVVCSLLLLQTQPSTAAPHNDLPAASPAATTPAKALPALRKQPLQPMQSTAAVHPVLSMTCPSPEDVTLRLSYSDGSWAITPNQVHPTQFTRAYGTIDQADKTKATLACLYQVTADYMAKTSYNGLQTCVANKATGKGKVGYTGPSDYTTNIAGTTAPGNLSVKKTGEVVQNQMLECQFHADGQAQLFKKYQAPTAMSSCQPSGREVTCR